MHVAADFNCSKRLARALTALSAPGALVRARMLKPGVVRRLLGAGLMCVLAACSTPPKGGGADASGEMLVNAEMTPEIRKENEKQRGVSRETMKDIIRQVEANMRTSGTDTTAKPTSTPLTRYYWQVTGQVQKKWHLYLKLRQHEGLTAGYLELVFYVNKRGKVEDLRIVDAKESNPLLTEIILQAIKDAEIPRMPVEVMPLLPKNDPERLKIEYNVLIY